MSVPIDEQKCDNCVFYRAVDSSQGRCREVSPRTVDWRSGVPHGVFPVINSSAWCGSWKEPE